MNSKSKSSISMHVTGNDQNRQELSSQDKNKLQFSQENLKQKLSKWGNCSAEQACIYLQLKDEGCKKSRALQYSQHQKYFPETARASEYFNENQQKKPLFSKLLSSQGPKRNLNNNDNNNYYSQNNSQQEIPDRFSNRVKEIISGNKIDQQIDYNLEKQKIKQQSELKKKLECMDEYIKNLDKEYNYTSLNKIQLKRKLKDLHQNILIRSNKPTKYLKMDNIKFYNILDQVLIKNKQEKNLLKKLNAFPPLIVYDKQKMEIKEKVIEYPERRPDELRNSQTILDNEDDFSNASLRKIQIFQDSQLLLKQLNGSFSNEQSIKPQSPSTIQQFNQSNYLFPRRDSSNSVELNQQQQIQLIMPAIQRRSSLRKSIIKLPIQREIDSPYSQRNNSYKKSLIIPIQCSADRQNGEGNINKITEEQQKYEQTQQQEDLQQGQVQQFNNNIGFPIQNFNQDYSPQSSLSPTNINNNNNNNQELNFQDQLTDYIKQQINKINNLEKIKKSQNKCKSYDSEKLQHIKQNYEDSINKEYQKMKPSFKHLSQSSSRMQGLKNDFNSTMEQTCIQQFAKNSSCSFFQPKFMKNVKFLVN